MDDRWTLKHLATNGAAWRHIPAARTAPLIHSNGRYPDIAAALLLDHVWLVPRFRTIFWCPVQCCGGRPCPIFRGIDANNSVAFPQTPGRVAPTSPLEHQKNARRRRPIWDIHVLFFRVTIFFGTGRAGQNGFNGGPVAARLPAAALMFPDSAWFRTCVWIGRVERWSDAA